MTLSNPKEALERVRALRTWLAEKHAFAGRGELPADVVALDALIADRDGLAREVAAWKEQYDKATARTARYARETIAAEARLSALEGAAVELRGWLERTRDERNFPAHLFGWCEEADSRLAALAPAVPVQEEPSWRKFLASDKDWLADHGRKMGGGVGQQAIERLLIALDHVQEEGKLCEGCPEPGYPTDKTRCLPCPRRAPEHPNPGRTVSGGDADANAEVERILAMSDEEVMAEPGAVEAAEAVGRVTAVAIAIHTQEQREARREAMRALTLRVMKRRPMASDAELAIEIADAILNDEGVRS